MKKNESKIHSIIENKFLNNYLLKCAPLVVLHSCSCQLWYSPFKLQIIPLLQGDLLTVTLSLIYEAI